MSCPITKAKKAKNMSNVSQRPRRSHGSASAFFQRYDISRFSEIARSISFKPSHWWSSPPDLCLVIVKSSIGFPDSIMKRQCYPAFRSGCPELLAPDSQRRPDQRICQINRSSTFRSVKASNWGNCRSNRWRKPANTSVPARASRCDWMAP